MANTFKQISGFFKNQNLIVPVIFMAFVMAIFGAIHFVEDTYSSYMGIIEVERVLGIAPVNFEIVRWTISLSAQVGQIVFGYIYLADRKNNKYALVIASMFFAVDFAADLQDRSNARLFALNGMSFVENLQANTVELLWSAGFTLVNFTIGAELFLVTGISLCFELFEDAWKQYVKIRVSVKKTAIWARAELDKAMSENYETQGARRSQPRQRRERRESRS